MRAQKKSLYSCNKIGFNEEIFYFFMIFLRKVSVIKGVDGNISNLNERGCWKKCVLSGMFLQN